MVSLPLTDPILQTSGLVFCAMRTVALILVSELAPRCYSPCSFPSISPVPFLVARIFTPGRTGFDDAREGLNLFAVAGTSHTPVLQSGKHGETLGLELLPEPVQEKQWGLTPCCVVHVCRCGSLVQGGVPRVAQLPQHRHCLGSTLQCCSPRSSARSSSKGRSCG